MFRPMLTKHSLRTYSFAPPAAVVTFFVAIFSPLGASAASGQFAADGWSIATGRTIVGGSHAQTRDQFDKWFISVISMQGCGACERLKHDFANAENLAALVNTTDHGQSWSHFNVYEREDASQMDRWKNVRFKMFPTIVIQPPLSGEFGDPRTIVWQRSGYDGDDGRLTQEIRLAITSYVAQLPQGESARPLLANLPQLPAASSRQAVRDDNRLSGLSR